MKSVLIVCGDDQIDLLLTNAIARPLAIKNDVFIDCPDVYGPLFVNNIGFKGSVEDLSAFDEVVDLKVSNEKTQEYRNVRAGKASSNNLFQLFFSIFGIRWGGQGYDLHYFPRNRQKRNSVGIAVRSRWLKDYITNNIIMKDLRIWDIPLKANIVKQLDEVNRCSHIITDDENCVHVALALRKHVEFVVTTKPPYVTEMFGSGNLHIFDYVKLSQGGQNAHNTSSG
jgi:hypothetical protein